MLTIAFVTGTEPGKWFRRYEELSGNRLSTVPSTDPFRLLAAGEEDETGQADIALMRLPDPRVGDEHHVVRLYDEASGVAVPKDSIFAELGEAVAERDLDGEICNFTYVPGADSAASVDELRAALQVVAANVGVARAPLPLLKALSKKQVVPLELKGAADGETQIGLVWRKERDAEDVQDFVGVAKGRTVRSSRGRGSEEKRSSANSRIRGKGKVHREHSRNRKRTRRPH